MAVKLRTDESYKFGQKNILPELGMVDISSEGIVDVPDEKSDAATIVAGLGIGWYIDDEQHTTTTTTTMATEQLQTKSEQNDLGKAQEDKNDIGGANEDEEKKAMIAALSVKPIEELQELAKPFKPVAEWKKLGQSELVAYLTQKLS